MNETDIEKMNFKELRSKVYELESVVIKLKRMYEDVIYNLDDSNFSSSWVREKNNMKAQLRLTAEELSSIYTRVDNDLTTMQTEISQTAEEISLKASKTEVDKWGNDLKKEIAAIEINPDKIKASVSNEVTKQMSSLTIDYNQITMTLDDNTIISYESDVNRRIIDSKTDAIKEAVKQDCLGSFGCFEPSGAVTVINDNTIAFPSNRTKNAMRCLYKGDYYYYTNGTEYKDTDYGMSVWKKQGDTPNDKIMFKMGKDETDNKLKFMFTGDVQISGNLITTGTISSKRIETSTLACTKLYNGQGKQGNTPFISVTGLPDTYIGGFGLYKAEENKAKNVLPNDTNCIFGVVEMTAVDKGGVNFYSHGVNFFGYNYKQNKTYPKGTWDFSSCDVILPDSVVRQS